MHGLLSVTKHFRSWSWFCASVGVTRFYLSLHLANWCIRSWVRESREITRNRHVQGVCFVHVFRRICVAQRCEFGKQSCEITAECLFGVNEDSVSEVVYPHQMEESTLCLGVKGTSSHQRNAPLVGYKFCLSSAFLKWPPSLALSYSTVIAWKPFENVDVTTCRQCLFIRWWKGWPSNRLLLP